MALTQVAFQQQHLDASVAFPANMHVTGPHLFFLQLQNAPGCSDCSTATQMVARALDNAQMALDGDMDCSKEATGMVRPPRLLTGDASAFTLAFAGQT